MSTRNRIGNKWTVNEVLSLQREYELLEWDIDQIAEKHGRTANAIMYKLDQEGFADYNVLFSNYHYHSFNNAKMPVNRTQNAMALEPSLSDEDDNTIVDDEQDEDYVDDGDEDEEDDEENPWDEDDEDPLTERVSKLESGLDEIKHMLKMLTSSVHGLSQATYGSNNVKYGSNGVPRGVDF
jgi:hypothetical protein